MFDFVWNVLPFQNYLTTFGYLSPLDPTSGRLRSNEELHQAVRMLQRMGNIPENGKLDDPALLKLIGTDRCGVPDVGPADKAKRKRRYVLHGSKWLKKVNFKRPKPS